MLIWVQSNVANPATLEISRGNVKRPETAKYTSLSKSSLDKLRVYGGGPLYIKAGARSSMTVSTSTLG